MGRRVLYKIQFDEVNDQLVYETSAQTEVYVGPFPLVGNSGPYSHGGNVDAAECRTRL